MVSARFIALSKSVRASILMENIILFYLINQHQNSKTYTEFGKKNMGVIIIIIKYYYY